MSNPEPIAGRMHGLVDQARSCTHIPGIGGVSSTQRN